VCGSGLLLLAAALQAVAVAYGLVLRSRRRAAGAWSFLLGAMLSMLAWRVVVLLDIAPPPFFNPAIAIWGSTCMVIAMFLFGRKAPAASGPCRARRAARANAARSDAERASSSDEFATLSHELRTPLASILGWCSLLRLKRDNPAEVDRALDTIERNANVQVRLVDDLLDATSIQAGKLQLDRRRVRLDDVVRTAVEMSRPAAQAKGIALEFAESVPALVDGDASRLQQIVINLLSNAVKFTPAHGHVRVAVAVEDTRAILTVRDDGAGIDPAFVPHVFTRFRQGDSSTTRLHGGLASDWPSCRAWWSATAGRCAPRARARAVARRSRWCCRSPRP
jgi:signal transduction histidine kinase